nr:hypothetical protein [Pandoravirus massiliensis]
MMGIAFACFPGRLLERATTPPRDRHDGAPPQSWCVCVWPLFSRWLTSVCRMRTLAKCNAGAPAREPFEKKALPVAEKKKSRLVSPTLRTLFSRQTKNLDSPLERIEICAQKADHLSYIFFLFSCQIQGPGFRKELWSGPESTKEWRQLFMAMPITTGGRPFLFSFRPLVAPSPCFRVWLVLSFPKKHNKKHAKQKKGNGAFSSWMTTMGATHEVVVHPFSTQHRQADARPLIPISGMSRRRQAKVYSPYRKTDLFLPLCLSIGLVIARQRSTWIRALACTGRPVWYHKRHARPSCPLSLHPSSLAPRLYRAPLHLLCWPTTRARTPHILPAPVTFFYAAL